MKDIIASLNKQGFSLFPCNANKTPATSKGFYDAHRDLDLSLRQFWNPEFLIGLPCGNENGIVVIDIDIKDGRSVDEIKEELKQYGEFPETFEVETMSGGRHLYYRLEKETSLNSAVRFFDKSLPVDIRANGGYVITYDYKKYFPLDVEDTEAVRELMAVLPEFVEGYQKPNEYVEPQAGVEAILPPSEVRELRSALAFIDADDRDMWVKVGHALKSIGSPQAKGIFFEWSMKSDKFDSVDTEKKWKTFKPHEITVASIFGIAKQNGWVTTYEKETPVFTPEQLEAKVKNKKVFEKKPFPAELLKPVGFVGEVAEYMNSQAMKDQPILHLGASLAFAGALMGQRYRTETNVRSNIYVIGIGETGCGKENARNCIKRITKNSNEPKMKSISATEEIASDTAIYNSLLACPSPVFLLDEVGRFLQTTKSAYSSHLYGIPSVLLKAYGSSDTEMAGKSYADTSKNIMIEQPNLCMYATATPSQFFDSLSKENIEDGLVARMLIFESETPRQRTKNRVKKFDPPAHIVEKARHIFLKPTNAYPEGNISGSTAINPYIVPMTEEAIVMLENYDIEIESLRDRLIIEKRIHSIYNRCRLIAEKLAMIVSVCENPDEPIIHPRHVDWSIKLVRHLYSNLQYAVENFISENELEREQKKILVFIRENEQVTLAELTRRFSHMKKKERDDSLDTLMKAEYIEEQWRIESEIKRVKVYTAI